MPDNGTKLHLSSIAPLGVGRLGVGRVQSPNLAHLEALKASNPKQLQGAAVAQEPSAEVKKAATQFEALLLQQMMGAMWSTLSKKDDVLGSREEETYRDMLNEGLSQEIAKGRGIGVKEVVMRELQGKQGYASTLRASRKGAVPGGVGLEEESE